MYERSLQVLILLQNNKHYININNNIDLSKLNFCFLFRFFFIYEKSFYLYVVDLWAFWRDILAWKYFQYEFAWMTSRWNTHLL